MCTIVGKTETLLLTETCFHLIKLAKGTPAPLSNGIYRDSVLPLLRSTIAKKNIRLQESCSGTEYRPLSSEERMALGEFRCLECVVGA